MAKSKSYVGAQAGTTRTHPLIMARSTERLCTLAACWRYRTVLRVLTEQLLRASICDQITIQQFAKPLTGDFVLTCLKGDQVETTDLVAGATRFRTSAPIHFSKLVDFSPLD